ncbi:conserved protein of unknown function [Rhodovastum atsumiense]|uniref:DUF1636 domain-containing protein n=1 Tax=Rhodovastum atsumiense TaxID=504468 RepID=UPI001EEFC013|nr:DUF1636 domain-containing protein [Rhodovastum atsumiense]CAH2601103.1 conserved protein of unknown function [Rhodovastum atsumiense]
MSEEQRARLIVCTTCRAGRPLAEGETPPGALLHADLQRRIVEDADSRLELAEVKCLACCDRGCSCAITMPGKWTYLLGHLSPGSAGDLLEYATAYLASASGAVLPSRRPPALRGAVIGRLPAAEMQA